MEQSSPTISPANSLFDGDIDERARLCRVRRMHAPNFKRVHHIGACPQHSVSRLTGTKVIRVLPVCALSRVSSFSRFSKLSGALGTHSCASVVD